MKYFKKLVGDRIYLSPRSSEDAEKFTEWLNDFETTDYIERSAQILTLDEEKEYLQSDSSGKVNFVIVTLDENKFIGTVSLENINYINRTAVMGIFIGDKDYRGNGFGTEAIRLILEYGFKYLNLNSIELGVFEFNERAIKSYKKCGFKECGRRRQKLFLNGKYYDALIMDILKDEFEGDWIRNKNV